MTKKSSSGGFLFKTGAFAVLVSLIYWAFNHFSGTSSEPLPPGEHPMEVSVLPCQVPAAMLPALGKGELVEHTWYVLSYDENHELARWVAWELQRDRLKMPWQDRAESFFPDPMVHTESATPRDYSGSGYDRGHICPAADMAFDSLAMAESFYMSNIAPQLREFNVGVWKDLEHQTRAWAKKFGSLYVVAGPVLTADPMDQIGFSKVSVPTAYYRVMLTQDLQQGIGFIVPQQGTLGHPLSEYAASIDEVERATGIDFFPQLLNTKDGEWTEAARNLGFWGM
ncbi:MAG: DNA/RNA non-specific endonuclease [Lewinellaceae bacterium]|nr:DNA/RNA non-specific endonuclease [Lewinellaceae bacterium]